MKIKRFLQEPGHCATASAAAIGYYYNSDITYEISQQIVEFFIGPPKEGLGDGDIGRLFNLLGFKKVNIVTNELNMIDYSWANLSRKKLLEVMEESKNKICETYREDLKLLIEFLSYDDHKNKITVDYNFGKYIRKNLKQKIPITLSFNWTMFFKLSKENCWKKPSPLTGDCQYHAVVASKFDKNGVYVCDSHHECYKYKLKRFKSGRYKISWENLMTIIDTITIPTDYDIEIYNKTIKEMG